MRLPSLVALLLCAPGALRGQTACPTPWQLEEVLRIGSAESTDLVSSVMDLAIGPDSALYVAQAMEPSVTVFSLDGQVLRRIGRAGRGPGDFELLARGVGWIGDTLWVADLDRIQLFTTDERVPAQVIQFSRSVPEEGTVEIGHGRSSLVPWDPRLAVALAGRDEVWGATYDDFGVPYIHRYVVDRTCGP